MASGKLFPFYGKMMSNKRKLIVPGLTTKFDMTFHVGKSPDDVFNYISQPDLFVSIHPVIYKIQELEMGSWKIFEKLHFGGIPFSFSYPASMQCDSVTREITMKAVVMNVVAINLLFQIQKEVDATKVFEAVTISSLLPVHPFVKSVFLKQHQVLFNKLK